MPYFQVKTRDGKTLDFLLDTGSSKNYIRPTLVLRPKLNDNRFSVKSVGGDVEVSHHTLLNMFGVNDVPLKFFLLPGLVSFDGILGNDSLKELSAVIHTSEDYFQVRGGKKIAIRQRISQNVNSLELEADHLSLSQRSSLNNIARQHRNLFSDPDERLTYTSVVVGEIRTENESPIYTRSYPYPMALKDVVEEEIRRLLRDGIIRPSRSPYNSPIWVVPKKEDSSGRKKYRLVVDFRKLNAVTIPDKYPIPEVTEVLSNLGGNQYFTVIDLKSGFHQIPLREEDRQKTAFSINNGKYEFTRLPFGLRNAPAIFQRTLDDILRELIGKICFVYIDDIIIFGKDEKSHAENIKKVFQTLESANMKIQLDKCSFFKQEVEFLGFIVSRDGIKTNPKKVEAILNFPIPKTLKELRSFLGLSGYYRRFVRGYADVAKPLTSLLRGEEGRIPKTASSQIPVTLDVSAVEAFNELRNALVSNDVILAYPDFREDFDLTTDASSVALGAVLSQKGRPIAFISRTLDETEEHYATNEREMLAIIWALTTLRNYLYGSKKVIIYTDHQPLTYAISNKNSNVKMKRWKCTLEEYNYELRYKPGRQNVVADALSRTVQKDNNSITPINSLTPTQHSAESSPETLIPSVESPINVFKNQLLISVDDTSTYQFNVVFPSIHRHTITEPHYDERKLQTILKRYLNPSVINGIKAPEQIMGKIQNIYPLHFSQYKCRFTQKVVEDILSENDQERIIIDTHNRAHRNDRENKTQILENYYFPGMSGKIKRIIKLCTTCKKNKYERHPNEPYLCETPIPNYPGHTIHIDIFSTDRKLVLTSIDKFSKYVKVKILDGRSTEAIRRPLRELLFSYGVPKNVVMDNEPSLNSSSILFMMKDELGINIFTTPSYRSEANGQIERFHSTLAEIMRCLKGDGTSRNFEELLERAVNEYNHSIHSTVNRRPVDLYFGRTIDFSPQDIETTRRNIVDKLRQKQANDLTYHNKKKRPVKDYIPGQLIYVSNNKRLGTKLSDRYKEEIVKENRNTTVLTESGRVIHKSHIRN